MNEQLKKHAFVDIGANTALVYWRNPEKLSVPETYFFNSKKRYNSGLLQEMRIKFYHLMTLIHKDIDLITFESVALWSGSVKSQTSASRGDTFNLAILLGIYVGIAIHFNIKFRFLDAREWKGQMPKHVTESIVREKLGIEFENDHIYDAVGIGLAHTDIWPVKVKI